MEARATLSHGAPFPPGAITLLARISPFLVRGAPTGFARSCPNQKSTNPVWRTSSCPRRHALFLPDSFLSPVVSVRARQLSADVSLSSGICYYFPHVAEE
jgi:hypothetical protein